MKTIYSEYNKETGISKVIIGTECGHFTGISRLHPEDKDIESNFAGCHYAEMRALIKYMKRKAANLQNQIDILKNTIKMLSCEKDIKRVQKEIYLLEDRKYQFKEYQKQLKEKIKEEINKREKIARKEK